MAFEGLKGGRPPSQDPQWGFLDARRRDIEDIRPGFLCVGGNPYAFIDSFGVLTTITVHLQAIGYLPYDLAVDQVTLYVTGAGAASSKARVGLYLFNVQAREFQLIAGTEVNISTASIGVKELPLTRPIELSRKAYYFLGFTASDVTATFAALASGSPFAHFEFTNPASTLPSSVRKLHTIRAYGSKFGVIYQAASIGGAPNL